MLRVVKNIEVQLKISLKEGSSEVDVTLCNWFESSLCYETKFEIQESMTYLQLSADRHRSTCY